VTTKDVELTQLGGSYGAGSGVVKTETEKCRRPELALKIGPRTSEEDTTGWQVASASSYAKVRSAPTRSSTELPRNPAVGNVDGHI
jgi:hypothetical protein